MNTRGARAALRDTIERAYAANSVEVAGVQRRIAELDADRRVQARDTVRDGALVIATAPAYTDLARRTLAEVSPVLRRRWSIAPLARAYEGSVIRVVSSRERRLGLERTVTYVDIERGGRGARMALLAPIDGDTVAALREYLEHTTAELMGERIGIAVAAWLGTARISDADAASNQEAAFIDLVSAPALVSRQCAAGDTARCLLALGLLQVKDPKGEFFTNEDRRVVARSWWRATRPQQPGRVEAVAGPIVNPCSMRPATAACLAFADSLPSSVWTKPLSHAARFSVLRTAVDLGGQSAWGRFVADTGAALLPRLEAAAQRPAGAIITAWRERVLRARPEPVLPRGTMLIAASIVVLVGLGAATVARTRT